MVFISARFLSLLLTALAAGIVLSHVMSRAGKITLPGPLFITVQNTLYRGRGKRVGVVEITAFLSTLIVVFRARGSGPILAFYLAGLLCLVGMMLLWAVCINPINVRVRASPSECSPSLKLFEVAIPPAIPVSKSNPSGSAPHKSLKSFGDG